MRHTTVHFQKSILDGEEESLQEIIRNAFNLCFIEMAHYNMPTPTEIEFDLQHPDFDYIIRCLTSIFESLGVTVEIEAPFDPCFEFFIG